MAHPAGFGEIQEAGYQASVGDPQEPGATKVKMRPYASEGGECVAGLSSRTAHRHRCRDAVRVLQAVGPSLLATEVIRSCRCREDRVLR